jgi:hypothetical protein
LPSARTTEGTPTGSHKSVSSNHTKNKHESPNHPAIKKAISNGENTGDVTTKKTHAQKISEGSTSQKPTKQSGHDNTTSMSKGHETAKTSLRTENKFLALPSHSDSISEVVKRNSEIKVFTSELGSTDKPVEIEVKSYTPPLDVSAVIEVKPNTYNSYHTDLGNYAAGNVGPGYLLYPQTQETYGPFNWYMDPYQQPAQLGLSYVPTEELLHSQSFSNSPSLNSELLYQYPLKGAMYPSPVTSLWPKPDKVQEKSPEVLNNHIVSSKPDYGHEYKSLPNYPVIFPARSSSYDLNTPQLFQYGVPQNDIQPYFLPASNEIQNPLVINTGPELNDKQGLLKYVTKSFYLKTHPKLEWVPL